MCAILPAGVAAVLAGDDLAMGGVAAVVVPCGGMRVGRCGYGVGVRS